MCVGVCMHFAQLLPYVVNLSDKPSCQLSGPQACSEAWGVGLESHPAGPQGTGTGTSLPPAFPVWGFFYIYFFLWQGVQRERGWTEVKGENGWKGT